ncbi:MAG TPA: glycosyltransferase family 4 protein, partial [Chitinophagaceae bacterium]
DRRKILVFVDWFYPGYKAGGPIQSCRNFIAALQDEYRVEVVTSDRDLGDTMAYEGITVNEWNDYNDTVKVFYADALNAKQVRQLVEASAPDYIYLNSLFSLRYAILPMLLKWQKRISPVVVIAPRGMLQAGALQFKSLKKKLFIRLINLSGLPASLVFHATDEQERQDIQKAFPSGHNVFCIPNFPRSIREPLQYTAKQPGDLRCVYVSRLAPKKNILYFLQLLHRLPGDTRLSLVIRGEVEDSSYWQQCQQAIRALPGHITVTFDGPVQNDSIIPFLQQHHLFVLPTLGENYGHAIVESFVAGRPVLISDKTPWRGLSAKKAGWDVSLAKEEAFITAMQQAAAMGQQEFNDWCNGARQVAVDTTTQSDLKQEYLKLFN